MPRWSPFWTALLSFGGLSPLVRADQPPRPQGDAAPMTAAAGQTSPAAEKPLAPGGKVSIKSDSMVGVNGQLTLKGHVVLRQGARTIKANQIEYDRNNNSLRTAGGIDYTDPLVHVTGSGGSYSPIAGARFESATFSLVQRSARGAAREMQLSPEGLIRLEHVAFTTCPVNDQSWVLRATRISLDTRNRVGTGRNARVDFKGVPILYLPWVSFPLGNVRKSGFLFPTVGNTSRGGAQVSIPYYFNIAPNMDFTFQPTEYTRRGADVGGDFRYLTQRQHGELDWDYLPNDAEYGASRSRIRLLNVAELPDGLRLTLDGENVSDTQYFEDFSSGPEGTSTPFLDRRAMLSYRDLHWDVQGIADQYQTIDSTLLVENRPYARLPDITVSADYGWGPGDLLRYGFDSEVVDFRRSTGVDGWRLDLYPTASLNMEGPGYFLRPSLAYRATRYQLSDTAPGESSSLSRTLPIASLDTGLQLERAAGSHDQRTITLEPRVMYLYVPYRDQRDLPVFDTAVPDLDPVELFRTNRYVGADRVGDANQVSAGITTRLLNAVDGRQYLTATFGQEIYFTDPRVTLPGELARTDRRSDLVAQLALTAFEHWSADAALQWNPQSSRTQRAQLQVQYRPAPDRVINVGYRFERGIYEEAALVGALRSEAPLCGTAVTPSCNIQQLEASAAWPIGRSWSIFARGVYSLADHVALERFAGFEYRACCWSLRMGARRYVGARPTTGTARTGPQDTGIWLQLELTGLASVGSASDASLVEAIPGYTPTEANTQAFPAR
ncbi:MAG TPA: LPS-assembly protein LptD [Steroidobacteraceae bacterium]|jgi:LPS-assembly protein|nr:LPS-assembly protein LptD [Steroidobacteraceae bacterium]